MKTKPTPPPWPKGAPSPLRGTRHPWAGKYGDFTDGRSKISYLARRIEDQLRDEYVTDSGWAQDRLELAAKYFARARVLTGLMGGDPKTSDRAAVRMQRAGEQILATLERTKKFTRPDRLAARVHRGRGWRGRGF